VKTVAIVGRSGSGKTQLIVRLIEHFRAQGLSVSTLKHTHHHAVEIDRPGKDSALHRAAGAQEVMLASDARWALMRETPQSPWSIDALIARMAPVELLLVEGFRGVEALARIEVFRGHTGEPPLAASDATLRALACPRGAQIPPLACPRLDLDDTQRIARFIATSI
jgi:molybdopterin-guanine dinucleotide biosynthesis adapter protein